MLFRSTYLWILAEDFFKTSVDGVMVMGYKYGFLAACIGMIIGQIVFNLLAPRILVQQEQQLLVKQKSTCSRKETFNKTRKPHLGNCNFNLFRSILLGRL